MKKNSTPILSIFIFGTPSPNALALSSARGGDPTGKSRCSIIEKTPWLDPTDCAADINSKVQPDYGIIKGAVASREQGLRERSFRCGAVCSSYEFIKPQPWLISVYNNLMEI